MKRHSISGWDIFHKSRPTAPPIISVRIMLSSSSLHQQDGMTSVYINLLRNIIHRESQAFSIAGTPFVSWGLEHITIGIHTLEEDLRDFLTLVQQCLRIIPSQKMIDEELQQQKSIDQWNATQPRELMYGTLYEQYFGPTHSLRSDIDGTWKQRSSIDQKRIKQVVQNSCPTSMIIVSRLQWDEIISVIASTLQPTKEIAPCSYQQPTPNWNRYSVSCSQSDQVGLMLVCPARLINDPLEYATDLGLMCLAGMFHSRMNKKLRIDDGGTYGVECHYIRNKNWARVELSCFVHEDYALRAWNNIQEVWSHADNDWTQEELNKTRTVLIRNERLREETCAQTSAILSYQLQSRKELVSIAESCQRWSDVSLDDVQRVMTELTKAPQLCLCVGRDPSIQPFGWGPAPCPEKFIFP